MVLGLLRDRDARHASVVEAIDQRLREELDSGGSYVQNISNVSGALFASCIPQSKTRKFPFDNAELSASLEPPVMRALNDLWKTLAGTCMYIFLCL